MQCFISKVFGILNFIHKAWSGAGHEGTPETSTSKSLKKVNGQTEATRMN